MRVCKNICEDKSICPNAKPYNNVTGSTFYQIENNAWCRTCDRLMVDHDNNISVCINCETRVIMKSVSQDLKPAEELIQTMSEIDKIINDRLREQ